MLDQENQVDRRFEVIQKIADSNAGHILLVKDKTGKHGNSDTPLALKVYNHTPCNVEKHLQDFHKTFETAKNIEHKNLVKHYEVVTYLNNRALLMEYVEGVPLESYFSSNELHDMGIKEIESLMLQMIDILEELKKHNLSMHTLYANHFMVSKDGTIKLVNIGLTKYLLRANQRVVHKVNLFRSEYTSRDIINNKISDESRNIYFLGVVLYELLTGKKLFHDQPHYSVTQFISNNSGMLPLTRLPFQYSKFENVIKMAVQPDYRIRFATFAQLKKALIEGPSVLDYRRLIPYYKQDLRKLAPVALGATIGLLVYLVV
jgi:serine/threonine protein kinase